MRVRANVVFHGRVQGVYFRANCRTDAVSRGLLGWVRNRRDGAVEAVFEGGRDVVEAAIEWNRTAQPYAKVSHVEVDWSDASGEFATFEVRH